MDCYLHPRVAAVGVCSFCGRGACRDCVAADAPRVICRACAGNPALHGFEYRSSMEIAGLPLIHVCTGADPVTMRRRVAKGVIAIGDIAVGGLAFGGVSFGLVTFGGLSIGLLGAVGGAALGLGVSLGGLAVGSVGVGGAAVGYSHAIGGAAFAPHAISATRCDPETAALVARWVGESKLPPPCR
ncbi:MAG TPA: hypothetical protein VK886_23740 [Vicinamibacterales bacterium]|nr:hypothetical protein [Vicinamibacterales bacterium]